MVCSNLAELRNVPCKKIFEGWRNAVIFKPQQITVCPLWWIVLKEGSNPLWEVWKGKNLSLVSPSAFGRICVICSCHSSIVGLQTCWITAVCSAECVFGVEKNGRVVRLREQWSTAGVQPHSLDALIYTDMSIPAFPHGLSTQLTSCCSYTLLVHSLDWPAGMVPVTLTTRGNALPRRKHHDDVITKFVRYQVMPGITGLPISVSVMATGASRNEVCLAVMLNKWSNFEPNRRRRWMFRVELPVIMLMRMMMMMMMPNR